MATATARRKIKREELGPGEILCDHCTAKCCRYFALPIDTPVTAKDFDFIRWYVLHGNASVFTEDGTWYLMIHAECSQLMPDNRCAIYETRPQICSDYSTDDCEYDGDDDCYDRYFETADQIREYAEAVLRPRNGKSFRSPKPRLLPVIG
jgi:Fe-S-cluster containining protein